MASLNPRDKQRQAALDDALQLRMSARFERKLRAEIAGAMRQAADAYEKRGELAIPMALSDHSAALRSTLEADYRYVAGFFGERLLAEAKAHHGPQVVKASLTEMLGFSINSFIGQWIATKVTQINSTTESQIRSLIRFGLDEGFGVDRIARTIREAASPMSMLRAHVIARTETHTAANFGAQTAAELTGLPMKREWVATLDARTRSDHSSADGQTRGMREAFTVGGQKLMYPGDPAGSASNTIQCRCAVVFLYE